MRPHETLKDSMRYQWTLWRNMAPTDTITHHEKSWDTKIPRDTETSCYTMRDHEMVNKSIRHLETSWEAEIPSDQRDCNLPRTSQHCETPQGIPEIPKYRHKRDCYMMRHQKNTKRHQDFDTKDTKRHKTPRAWETVLYQQTPWALWNIKRHHETPWKTKDTKGSLRYHHETPWDTTRQATMKYIRYYETPKPWGNMKNQ